MGIVFAAVFLGFSAALALLSPADAKVIRGTVSSREAWGENGKFVNSVFMVRANVIFLFNASLYRVWDTKITVRIPDLRRHVCYATIRK